jgi:protein TonB
MKRIIVLCLVFVALGNISFAQSAKNAPAKEEEVFTKVEVEATFPGGAKAFREYLQRNLKANTPIKHGAAAGTYTVVVKFIVGKTGKISNIEPETNWGYGMEKEVVRIIKKSPDWLPASQGGWPVNAYRRQPVTFVVSEK